MWIVDILALLGAIFLIVAIVQLRTFAALPFTRITARFAGAQAPAAVADLYATAASELMALGFGPSRWVYLSSPDASIAPLRAVHVHATAHAAIWLVLPTAAAPNRLTAYYVTRLLDGRVLVSQPFDAYFELYDSAQCLAQSLGQPTFAEQWQAHQAFVAQHGIADPAATTPEGLLHFNNEWMEQQRQILITRGDLRPVDADTALPTLGFAWRMRALFKRTPKPPLDTAPVPAARVALIATHMEPIRQRSPARSVELTLFATSIALFMGLGAVLWGMSVAWMILVVVVIHELGHFLAMRAFGYRNVHMLALPLVGGVAMGQDVDPSAHRSAWMSLMGPLPGIVIGWALLASSLLGWWPESVEVWPWAVTFLIVNYLNVLPIPPLDGGHVVQALLPPRRAWLEVGFIAIACTLGAWLAWSNDFILLAVIALLQLTSLSARLAAQRALAQVALDPPPRTMARSLRIRNVAEALERLLGPAPVPRLRMEQTLEVLHRLDRKPMRWWQSLAVATTLMGLMVVPVGALVAGFVGSNLVGEQDLARMQEQAAARQVIRDTLAAQAATLDDSQLVIDVSVNDYGDALSPPVPAAALADAEARLGAPLPELMSALYRMHDGIPALSLGPIAELKPAREAIEELVEIVEIREFHYDLDGASQSEPESVSISAAALKSWWLLGDSEGNLLLFDPDPAATVPILSLWLESPTGYRSVRTWLEQHWIARQEQRQQEQLIARRHREIAESLRAATWPELIAAMDTELPLAYRLLADLPDPEAPAADAALAAAEQRLGTALPADYRELLELRNGMRMWQLGPVEEVSVLDAAALAENQWLQGLQSRPDMTAGGGALLTLERAEQVRGCWDLGNRMAPASSPIIYCPPGHAHFGLINLQTRQRFPDVRSYVVSRVAQIQAVRNPLMQ